MVKNAIYDGILEIPVIYATDTLPNRLISFSKAMRTDDYDQWVHFYEDDASFERVWNRPHVYLEKLRRFNGVITPDFSLYRDMPLVMQQWNTYRGKALGCWWQSFGIKVIPNVRFSDKRSYEFCCCGVEKNAPIAIGSHGCLKIRVDREMFRNGLETVCKKLQPSCLIVYGATPEKVFEYCKKYGIPILQFDSEFACSRRGVSV